MREVVLDTETTGLDPSDGHRIIEIGCVELINHISSGETYHIYINPDRDVPEDATRIHGITSEFLLNKPFFKDICDDFINFISDSPLIIHNAGFDMKFINAELARVGRELLPLERAIDTLSLARKKFQGAPASLDSLCKRFGINNSHRKQHGALLDSELLAEVYLELCGGRQPSLILAATQSLAQKNNEKIKRSFRAPRVHKASEEEVKIHEEFIKLNVKNSIWFV